MAESGGTWRTTADGRGEEAARACSVCHWIGFVTAVCCPSCGCPILPGKLRTRQGPLVVDADLLGRAKDLAQRAVDAEGGHGTVVISAELLSALVTRQVPIGDLADALRLHGWHTPGCAARDGGHCNCGWDRWSKLIGAPGAT